MYPQLFNLKYLEAYEILAKQTRLNIVTSKRKSEANVASRKNNSTFLPEFTYFCLILLTSAFVFRLLHVWLHNYFASG